MIGNNIPFIGELSYSIEESRHVNGTINDDVIIGDEQNNRLNGNAGDDVIQDGLGRNNLSGGDGADTFVFNGRIMLSGILMPTKEI